MKHAIGKGEEKNCSYKKEGGKKNKKHRRDRGERISTCNNTAILAQGNKDNKGQNGNACNNT